MERQSPDANPIENLWHELKEFIRREVKPRNKQELIAGITRFWETVNIAKCKKYIGHLRKVVQRLLSVMDKLQVISLHPMYRLLVAMPITGCSLHATMYMHRLSCHADNYYVCVHISDFLIIYVCTLVA